MKTEQNKHRPRPAHHPDTGEQPVVATMNATFSVSSNRKTATASSKTPRFKETEIGRLPTDWQISLLGKLFDAQQGKAMSAESRNGPAQKPFLRTSNVLWGRVDLSSVDKMHFTDEETKKFILQPGDLLVCEGGEVGRAAVWNNQLPGCLYQNHIHRLRRRETSVDSVFAMYWLQEAILHRNLYEGAANRTTIPNLSAARLKEFAIPLPSPEEQRTIAAVLSKIQAAAETQGKIVATLKELKAATMAKVFREGLHREPLKQTEIGEMPQSWEVVMCDDLCEQITVGIVVTPAKYYAPVGIPCFRSFNIKEDRLSENNLVFISKEANELHAKSKLLANDVAIVRTGYPGTACVIPKKYEGANCIDLIIARPNHMQVISGYLARYINSPEGKRQVLMAQGGLAQQHFNVGAMKRLLVALPSKDEQTEISQIGKLLDSRILGAEKKRVALQSIFSSMLKQLMTGNIRLNHLERKK